MKALAGFAAASVLAVAAVWATAANAWPPLDSSGNPDDNAIATVWAQTTPEPCSSGLTLEAQTATFTAYTQTPVSIATCDISKP